MARRICYTVKEKPEIISSADLEEEEKITEMEKIEHIKHDMNVAHDIIARSVEEELLIHFLDSKNLAEVQFCAKEISEIEFEDLLENF